MDWTFSAAVAYFNGDGWPDIFVARHWHPANLYINNQNGTFSPADVDYFKSIIDRHDCHGADFNQDGLKDIFCSVGADRGSAVKSNALFIQQPDHTFVDEAYQWNVSDPWGRGRYGAVGSLCAHTVDYNSDGWPDLLVCGEEGGLHLFENDQGHGFKDVSSILGAPVNATDAAMVDVNHDSRPDLITLTRDTLAERLQLANGTSTSSAAASETRTRPTTCCSAMRRAASPR